jgi:hypothetical protein
MVKLAAFCRSSASASSLRSECDVNAEELPHPLRMTATCRSFGILASVNPRDRLRSVGRRMSDPAEALAQQVTERVVDIVLSALDINEIAALVDLNALLGRVDIDAVMKKVDLNALLGRVDLNVLLDQVDVNAIVARVDIEPLLDRIDVNDLVQRIDTDALVEHTDLGAVIARSSGGMASEALDAIRSQAVGLDQFVDRWVQRLLRRKHPAPPAPAALLTAPDLTAPDLIAPDLIAPDPIAPDPIAEAEQ